MDLYPSCCDVLQHVDVVLGWGVGWVFHVPIPQ